MGKKPLIELNEIRKPDHNVNKDDWDHDNLWSCLSSVTNGRA